MGNSKPLSDGWSYQPRCDAWLSNLLDAGKAKGQEVEGHVGGKGEWHKRWYWVPQASLNFEAISEP